MSNSTAKFINERNAKIAKWLKTKKKLDLLKKEEAEMRLEIGESFFDTSVESGTQTEDLGSSGQLKYVTGLSYTLENKKGETEDMIEKLPEDIIPLLVKWEAKLSVETYKNLDPEIQDIVDTVLTVKAKAPTLKYVPPKGK